MSLKRIIQVLLGKYLSEPCIPEGKNSGYSLVKSERADCSLSPKSKIYPPYYLHKVVLGDYSYIAKNGNVTNCTIGKFCSIGPNFCCGLGIHPTDRFSTSPMFYSTARQNGFSVCEKDEVVESKPITIGNDVFIGANVTVLDGVKIGDGAVIGAGAVVVKDIPDYAVAVGVPAKVVKYRFKEERIKELKESKWWDKYKGDGSR